MISHTSATKMPTTIRPEIDVKRLAHAVLLRAFIDATSVGAHQVNDAHPREAERDEARIFVTHKSEDLVYWCQLAQIDPQTVLRTGRLLHVNGWRREDWRRGRGPRYN